MTSRDRRLFLILIAAAVAFGLSAYFSSKKLRELRDQNPGQKTAQIVVVDAPSPDPKPVPSETPEAVSASAPGSGAGPKSIPGCQVDSKFITLKGELGKIVNNREMRESKTKEFLKEINEFKQKYGIPLPIMVNPEYLEKENVVYNKCRSTCNGSVYEVFVSQVSKAEFIQVLLRDGTQKKLMLQDSGIALASIDELNHVGVPYRSWLAPVSESDWYVKGKDIYYSLDIEGLSLKIDISSNWQVVISPSSLVKLRKAEEPLKILGCNDEEDCLEGDSRHFKAPQVCKP